MNAWLPQASYPCGNFSDTSGRNARGLKGSIGHAYTVCIFTGNQNQANFSPFGPREISVLTEFALGHLRYLLTDVPPQPNSPPGYVFRGSDKARKALSLRNKQDNIKGSGISPAAEPPTYATPLKSSHKAGLE
ncbi:hypothetical protein BBBOND_0208190 [Babesia bigemina]|nr:hypothetical protein BBBOND_0208190 [Babesia bigemina]CDR95665.1 hypothetical protein BBBOND_0208190 [Babesia bigemina]|eukprot:XP_012767851.1 hypothetical protein BBBOND_0208190 [Babesia bigemina]